MKVRFILVSLIISLTALNLTVAAQRTQVKPGRNVFTVQQDIDLGREAALDAEKQLNLVTNRDANVWVSGVGQRLLSKVNNEYKFPFTFKIVDEREINAFALPGGPVYINRGAIEAADNEAQIAGVIGHEIGHILLRHGTNQASKGQLVGGLAGVLGGILGNGTGGQIIAGLGAFGANSVLLRYSRDAETQSDLLGTQMLYDLGYAPQAMAQFFEKLAKEHKGSKTEQFFSNHPIPENRVKRVNDEIRKIGPPLSNPRTDTAEFQNVKRQLLAMPEPKPKPATGAADRPAANTPAPAAPSTRVVALQNAIVQLQHPDNWKPTVNGNHVTLAPSGGLNDRGDLSYGLIVDVHAARSGQTLQQATTDFLQGLQQNNPAMKAVRSRVQTRVDGTPALLHEFSNDSPSGGKERDVIVTVMRSNTELLYFVQVYAEKDASRYQPVFQRIMTSVKLR
jgi:Zn-dependent protease with chaperone function